MDTRIVLTPTYLAIGILVTIYYIWYYRYSKNKTKPKKSDALLGLIAPLFWPAAILKDILDRKLKKKK